MCKNYFIVVIIITIISSFLGCVKDGPIGPVGAQGPMGPVGNGSADPRLYAKWEVISGSSNLKYLTLNNDNICVSLYSNSVNFNSVIKQFQIITNSQITNYNYKISNDTLTLSNLTELIILKKNLNAPDANEWVNELNIIDSINVQLNSNYVSDMGFDGVNVLIVPDYQTDTIIKVNPNTHSISGYYKLNYLSFYGNVNYSNSKIWITDYEAIKKVNIITGNVELTSIPLINPGDAFRGLALAGNKMWFCSFTNGLFTWDTLTNEKTKIYPNYFDALEYVNGFLYLQTGNYIYKCELNPFRAVKTYYISDLSFNYSSGLTYDGSNFWIYGIKNGDIKYKLLKLSN